MRVETVRLVGFVWRRRPPQSVRFIVTGCVLLVAATIDAVSRRGRTSAGRA